MELLRSGHKTSCDHSLTTDPKTLKPSEIIRRNVNRINSGSQPVMANRKRVVDQKANHWWTKSFTEGMGDSSKIIELSDSDDEQDFHAITQTLPTTTTTHPLNTTHSQKTTDSMNTSYSVKTLNSRKTTDSLKTLDSLKTTDSSMRRKLIATMYGMKRSGLLTKKTMDQLKTVAHMRPKSSVKTTAPLKRIALIRNDSSIKMLRFNTSQPMEAMGFPKTTRPKATLKTEEQLITESVLKSFTPFKPMTPIKTENKCSDSCHKYVCILCPQICVTAEAAKNHYLIHLDVYIECGECHQKFTSLANYRSHNSRHLDRNKMLYLDEFMTAKKWCDHYVEYKPNECQLTSQLIRTYLTFCPVCDTIKRRRNQTTDTTSDTKRRTSPYKTLKEAVNEDYIRNHLHQHFQYFPYVCIDCDMEDKKTEFCLNETAREHLKRHHDNENADKLTAEDLTTYFDRKKPIKKLDHFIEVCLTTGLKMNSFFKHSRLKCPKRAVFVNKNFEH